MSEKQQWPDEKRRLSEEQQSSRHQQFEEKREGHQTELPPRPISGKEQAKRNAQINKEYNLHRTHEIPKLGHNNPRLEAEALTHLHNTYHERISHPPDTDGTYGLGAAVAKHIAGLRPEKAIQEELDAWHEMKDTMGHVQDDQQNGPEGLFKLLKRIVAALKHVRSEDTTRSTSPFVSLKKELESRKSRFQHQQINPIDRCIRLADGLKHHPHGISVHVQLVQCEKLAQSVLAGLNHLDEEWQGGDETDLMMNALDLDFDHHGAGLNPNVLLESAERYLKMVRGTKKSIDELSDKIAKKHLAAYNESDAETRYIEEHGSAETKSAHRQHMDEKRAIFEGHHDHFKSLRDGEIKDPYRPQSLRHRVRDSATKFVRQNFSR